MDDQQIIQFEPMAEQNNQIVTFNYEGTPISFNRGDAVMVNATEMAKPFGKRPVDWLNLPSTKEFIIELSNVRKSNISDFQPLITQQGSPVNGGGTWMHEDVAMEFARWLSPKFAIWCNDRIKELLQNGVVTAGNDDQTILNAITILQGRIQQNQRIIQQQTLLIEQKDKEIEESRKENELLKFYKEQFDKITGNTHTLYSLTDVAKFIGMRTVGEFIEWALAKNILMRDRVQKSKRYVYHAKGDYAGDEKGYFKEIIPHTDSAYAVMQLKVTSLGVAKIRVVRERYLKRINKSYEEMMQQKEQENERH